jgi:ATP-dependent DNA ligase
MDLSGLVMEPKLDGFRLLLHVGPNGVDTFTRTGKSQKGKLPHIEAALSDLPEGTWLDGELVAFDDKGFPEWGKVQTVMGSTVKGAALKAHILTYVVFDMLAYNGLDVRPLPLAERRAAMMTVLGGNAQTGETAWNCLQVAIQAPASHEYHDNLVAQGMEGTIVKDPAKPYASGKRGHGWIKFKANDEMDVVIIGYKPGENSFTGMIGAIEFGQYQPCTCANAKVAMIHPACGGLGKILVPRGRCSGMDMKTRIDITNNQQQYLGKVFSLAFMGIMPSGSPRHPQYKRMRIDKSPIDCEWT